MSVSKKRKRKIMIDNTEYLWYIRKDRYYDGFFFDHYGTPWSVSVISADKSFSLSAPVNAQKNCHDLPYPFEIPEAVTSGVVAKLIRWALKST